MLKAALLGYPASLVVPEAARLLDATPLPAKAALVEVLGEKGAQGEIERVYRLAEDADPVLRDASLRALAHLAGEADLPRLVSMLEKATETDTIVRLREAITAAALRNPDPERRGESLLVLLKTTTSAGKVEILKVLPRIGGAGPLRAVVEETASPDPAVQSAAVGALSRWPDPAAAEELLRLAVDDAEPGPVPHRGPGLRAPRRPVEPAGREEARPRSSRPSRCPGTTRTRGPC